MIHQLVNTKLKESTSVTDLINECILYCRLSTLVSVDIKFEDEVHALLLLSSFPKSWSGTVTTISSSFGTTKLTFKGIRDLLFGEDIRRKNSGENSRSLLSAESRG